MLFREMQPLGDLDRPFSSLPLLLPHHLAATLLRFGASSWPTTTTNALLIYNQHSVPKPRTTNRLLRRARKT
jgi:hypothetical protein